MKVVDEWRDVLVAAASQQFVEVAGVMIAQIVVRDSIDSVGTVVQTSKEWLMSVLDFRLVEGVQELSCFDLESLEHFQEPVVCSSP